MLSHHNSVTGSITNIIIMMQEQQQHRDIGYTFQFGILRIILTVFGKVWASWAVTTSDFQDGGGLQPHYDRFSVLKGWSAHFRLEEL